MLCCIFFGSATFAETNSLTGQRVDRKLYVEPGTVHVTPNGIFLSIDGNFFPVTGAIIRLNNFIRKFSLINKQRRTFNLILFSSVVFFILSFFLYFHQTKHSLASKIVHALSQKDEYDLKLLFRDLFANNELGYTLFGDKPMSFCFPEARAPYFSKRDYLFWIYREGALPLFKGLAVWKKIHAKIKNKNYSFIICEEKKFPTFVILINKKYFAEKFEENIDLFKKYYGMKITPECVLSRLENKKSYEEISKEPLFYNDVLLGIILGFGRHNAELFQRRAELVEPKLPFMAVSNKGFSSVKEEIEYLRNHLQLTSKTHDWLLRVIGVGFVGDPDDVETRFLVKKYDTLHEKLLSIFDRHDWLEKILAKLVSN